MNSYKTNSYLNKIIIMAAVIAMSAMLLVGVQTALAATTIYGDSIPTSSQGLRKGGSAVLPARSITASALGAPDGTFFSLGFGGSITIEFANYVGTNLSISTYEITNGTYPFETANVEVSQNGSTWTSVGTADNENGTGPNPHTTDFSLASGTCIKFVRVTDTSDPAPFTNDADGFDVDAVSATYDETCTPPPPCECTNSVTETFVSDLTTTVVGDSPVAVAVHPAWTASIPGATWIWKSGATASNETVAFEQSFTVSGTVLSAQLDIATDNSYKVFIDNVEIASDPNINNFQLATQDVHNLTLAVTPGTHTLRIEVKNVGTYNASSNPAGLLYKFEVKTCPPKCCGGEVTITNNNTAVVINNVSTQASTGGNNTDGGNGGGGGNGGDVQSSNNNNTGGRGGRGSNGGAGGAVVTGNAGAGSSVLNKVNTNIVRVRR